MVSKNTYVTKVKTNNVYRVYEISLCSLLVVSIAITKHFLHAAIFLCITLYNSHNNHFERSILSSFCK